MKRLLIAACALFGFIGPTLAGDLKTSNAFDTGKFLCSEPQGVVEWMNPMQRPAQIVTVESFLGMSGGAVADFLVKIQRISDGSIIQFTNWDHYKDPTALHNLKNDYGPNYFEIGIGDGIRLTYDCTGFGATASTSKGHVITRIVWLTQVAE